MSVSGVLVAFIADLSLLFQIDDSSTFGVASPVLSVLKRSLQDECITEQPRCVYEIAEATRLESKAALLHLFASHSLCESRPGDMTPPQAADKSSGRHPK